MHSIKKQTQKVVAVALLAVVFAINSLGVTAAKAADAPAPIAPASVDVTNITSDSADVTWVPAADDNATSYLIKQTGQFDIGGTFVAEVSGQTDYHLTNLRPNVWYTFSVATKDALGVVSSYADSQIIYTQATVPSNLNTSVVSDTEIKLTWDADGTYSRVINVSTGQVHDWKPSAREYTVTGLTCETEYEFQVQSANGADPASLTKPSDSIKANPGQCTHFMPTDLTLTNITTSSADLNWKPDQRGSEDTFVVRIGNQFGVIDFGEVQRADDMTLHIDGLKPNSEYQLNVAAKDNMGISGFSQIHLITLASVPSNFIASETTENTITLSWDTDGTYSHVINTVDGSDSGWTVGLKKFTFEKLKCNTSFAFRAQSENSGQVVTDFTDTLTVRTGKCAFPAGFSGALPENNEPASGNGGSVGGGSGQVLGEKILTSTSSVDVVTTTLEVVTTTPEVVSTESRLDFLVRTLKFTNRSNDVKELQTELRNRGFFPRWVRSTGYYWTITRGAVAKYLASK